MQKHRLITRYRVPKVRGQTGKWRVKRWMIIIIIIIGVCCETLGLISANQAINDKLQGSVATYLRCGGVVNNQIKKGLLLRVKKNLIGEYLAKLPART